MLFLFFLAVVAATAAMAAAQLAPRPLTSLVLATYVLAWAEIVGVSLLLSLGSWVTVGGYAVACGALLAAALAVTWRRRPALPSFGEAAGTARDSMRDPVLVFLGVVVALEVAYAAALALFTPQNDPDSLQYHLSRAAFWRQEHAIGYVDGALDSRLNVFPPFAEIASMFTMVTAGTDRFVALPTLSAALATAAAVYGIARRTGFDRGAAFFGALLFLTLPSVAMHAQSVLVDLPVAAFVAAAAYFALGRTTGDVAVAATSLALAIGTKVTGALAVPGIALLALVAWRSRGLRRLVVAGALAVAAGSTWYAVNVVETGRPLGDFPSIHRGGTDVVLWVGRTMRLALDAMEVTGAVGSDAAVYVGVAIVVLAVGTAAARNRGRRYRGALVTAALVLTPLLLIPANRALVRAYQKGWYVLGREDVGGIDPDRDLTRAGSLFSWYGPIGFLLSIVAAVLVVRAVRRRALDRVVLVLAAAPLLWIVLLGVAVRYFEWNGRFAMAGFALAAATWGIVLPRRAVAWAAAAVAATTVFLTYVHFDEKPSGLRLLEPTAAPSVWGQPRWDVQAEHAEAEELWRFAEEGLPAGARVALWPSEEPASYVERFAYLAPYPFFGASLDREVVFAETPAAAADEDGDWFVAPTPLVRDQAAPGWKVRLETESGWTVMEREH